MKTIAVWTIKGGVGKTTVAAALAEVAARHGRRTLVCEMDAKGALATAFDVGELTFEPTEVATGLSAMAMNTEDSLREYLRLFVRIPLLGRIGPLASAIVSGEGSAITQRISSLGRITGMLGRIPM